MRARQALELARTRERAELARSLAGIADHRHELDEQRAAVAAEHAGALVPDLLTLTAGRDFARFEDELCARIGALTFTLANLPGEVHASPGDVFDALVTAAADTVREALGRQDGEPDAWRAPWTLLTALARTAVEPFEQRAQDAIGKLRRHRGAGVLPAQPPAAEPTGPAQWTRDAYGSRFAVVAPFSAPDGTERWYLWDVDTCFGEPFTVHSGYFAGPREALAEWTAAVGPEAAGDGELTPVDHPDLLSDLLPAELGIMRLGGEDAAQFAEYHRAKRLAEELLARRPGSGSAADGPAQPPTVLDPAECTERFTARLAERTGRPLPPSQVEAAEVLVHDWLRNGIAELQATCSPHRVALFADMTRDFYDAAFAQRMLGLLPDWISWLAGYLGLPDALAERCQPYAAGGRHPCHEHDGRGLNVLLRVAE